MVRFSGQFANKLTNRESLIKGLFGGFDLRPVLLAPTVSAWGLLRLGAQKEKRERKRRPGAVLRGQECRA
jgi:hypothetical protein